MNNYLSMKGITKIYRSNNLLANNNVDFNVERGEIHALAGENGAGKTTLMKILYGLEKPDSGSIFLENSLLKISSPQSANNAGIGMVHQHFKLVEKFTVAQNVVLGREPRKGFLFFDNKKAEKKVQQVIDKNNFSISAGSVVSDLSVGQKQQVEIVKMLYLNAEILILDEPTSVLTEGEIVRFFETLEKLKSDGKTIILITHKLEELKRISDRITVMRKGKVVAVRNTADVSESEISRLMIGRSVVFNFSKEKFTPERNILELKNVSLIRKAQKRPLLNNVSFSVPDHKITGVTAVAGNGLSELEDCISGLTRISSGKIIYNGKIISSLPVSSIRDMGFSYVPADRLQRGSSLEMSIRENIIISDHHKFLKKGGILDNVKVDGFTENLISEFDISASPYEKTGNLSGGNIQKVILAREMHRSGSFIMFSEPAWGLDVGSSEFVYEKILSARKNGAAVLLLSSNIDEILSLADSIIVLYRGSVVMNRDNSGQLSRELIGDYMLGIKNDFSDKAEQLSRGQKENQYVR